MKRALLVFPMPVARDVAGQFLAFRCVIAGRHENLKLMAEVLLYRGSELILFVDVVGVSCDSQLQPGR